MKLSIMYFGNNQQLHNLQGITYHRADINILSERHAKVPIILEIRYIFEPISNFIQIPMPFLAYTLCHFLLHFDAKHVDVYRKSIYSL